VTTRVEVLAVEGVPEVTAGDDVAALVCAHAPDLRDGDLLVVTSKVLSKAEGRVVGAARAAAVDAETQRVVARRGPTTIARTRHGLTLAAAGVDASNVEPGRVVLLPDDPDASARALRARVLALRGCNVGVVVSDTAGRPWREGQTDIAIGCAGLWPLQDHSGRLDTHGNELEVTAPAVADEVAAAADLAKGKTAGRPAAVVRGLARLVLAAGEEGPGARALVRPSHTDMFALGAREAVVAAVCRDDESAVTALGASGAGDAVGLDRLVALATAGTGLALHLGPRDDGAVEVSGADDLPTAAALERLCALAVAHGHRLVADARNGGRCRIVLRSGATSP
jgi:coenzyme F420-0:L-glutamate ligase / coenzyme F420-1:gamma-L-glutamate ligase